MTRSGRHAPNTTTHTSSPPSQCPAPHCHRVMKADTDGALKPLRRRAVRGEPASHCRRGLWEFLGGKCESRSEMQSVTFMLQMSFPACQQSKRYDLGLDDESSITTSEQLCRLITRGYPKGNYPNCSKNIHCPQSK